jgi:hypothetical protein
VERSGTLGKRKKMKMSPGRGGTGFDGWDTLVMVTMKGVVHPPEKPSSAMCSLSRC